MQSPIQDVSDTAYWIAYHRKLETERPEALFRDPFAARLAGDRGKRISEAMPTSRVVAWIVAIRTPIIDELLRFALSTGIDTVLNLGAGLDARPYRLQLPPSLLWIEADHPHIIEYKEQVLQGETPTCRLERLKIDLADRDKRLELFTRVAAQSRGTLVITEGVTPYLSNDEVASLAEDLRTTCHARLWILDYSSRESFTFKRRRRLNRLMGNAPFKFLPNDWFAFFKQHGWQIDQMRYLGEEAARMRRPFPMPLRWRLIIALTSWMAPAERRNAFRRFAGFALLKPSA